MKKISLAVLITVPFWVFGQQSFKITGSVRGVEPSVAKVYISYAAGGQNVLDSSVVTGNKYRFEGVINEPTRIDLRASYAAKDKSKPSMSRDMITLFADPADIDIKSVDSFSNATVSGSKSNLEFDKLRVAAKPFESKVSHLLGEAAEYKKSGNDAALARTETSLEQLQAELKAKVYGDYIQQNPSSPLAFFALQQYSGAIIEQPKKSQELFNLLPQGVRQSPDGRRMEALIHFAQLTPVGSSAPEFTQSDPDGKAISLSDFRGKYVLINFWASWCGPCRAQNPTLIKLYDQYKEDGLEILNVSLDKPGGKTDWTEAIDQDKLTWPQVSDLRFWNNQVAKQYGVVALPQNVLIDKSGKIVAKNLTIEQISRKFKSIF